MTLKDEDMRELGEAVDPDELAAEKVPGEVIAEDVNREMFGHEPGADTAGTTGLPVQQPVDMASDSKIPEEPPEGVSSAEKDFDDPRHASRGTPHVSSSTGSS
jgi:hypothetical protein